MIKDFKSEILNNYKYKTELHAHTLPVSRCSEFYADELVERYAKLGVDTIVVANHLTPYHFEQYGKEALIKEYLKAYDDLKRAAEPFGISAIMGVELRFSENINDYLVFGVKEDELSVLCDSLYNGIESFYKSFKREGVLIFQAHPKRDKMEEVDAAYLDGYEAFNLHPGHNSRISIAAREAAARNLKVIGGTDFHHPNHEGGCLLLSKEKIRDSETLVSLIESGDYALLIGGSVVLP